MSNLVTFLKSNGINTNVGKFEFIRAIGEGGNSFVYLFKKEFSKKLYMITITVFLTLLCIINSSYYNYFSSYTSISQLVTTKYLG